MNPKKKTRLRTIMLRSIALFACISAVSTVSLEIVYRSQIANRLDAIALASDRVLDLQQEIVRSELESITSDLLFLARQNELLAYLETGDRANLGAAAREYLEMARQKGIYSQVRFLDSFGMEIVRIDFEDGTATIVPQEKLQSKQASYYFIRTFVLDDGEIYVSPFDLNVEQGVIQEPREPTIRFGTPIYDSTGKCKGIVVLNYLGEKLFRALGQAAGGTDRRTFLANWESYWLLGPDPSVEWGFMYFGTGVHTVDTSFPGAWEHLSAASEGEFRLDSGLFVFTTIHPIDVATHSGAALDHEDVNPGVWKLISFVPTSVLAAIAAPIRRLWGIAHGILMILAAGAAWFYVRYQVLRSEYRSKIELLAKHDSLTGACNRHYFEGSLAGEEARARRYRHPISFLMIDITRFKQINDTHGHQVGDKVLIEVAAILKANVREADVVIRYGGDEFLIMFPETPGEADVARQRILEAIDKFNADGERFNFPVILSLGSAQWNPSSGATIEDALADADEQMYEHKQSQHDSLGDN